MTIFPGFFDSFLAHGILRRARDAGIIRVRPMDIRDFTHDAHRTTDDRPYGGGPGMVMIPGPLAEAIGAARDMTPGAPVILLSPQGRPFRQALAAQLAALPGLVLVCGRYEGVDERIHRHIDDEISIGDFVLTGGEPGALVIMDAVTRLLPGALGDEASACHESFAEGLLEHAHYTRPRVFEGEAAPEVLLSGHHAAIEAWRLESSLWRTLLKRPDLLETRALTGPEKRILTAWRDRIDQLVAA